MQRGPDFPQTWSKMHRTNLKIILQSHLRYLRTLYPGSRFASRIRLDTIGFSCCHLRRVRGSERWKLVGLFSVFLWFYCAYSKWIFVLSSELNERICNSNFCQQLIIRVMRKPDKKRQGKGTAKIQELVGKAKQSC